MVDQVEAAVDPAVEPIVISLEGYFHGLQNPNWESKIIRFPRGGVLWSLNLSKQPTGVNTSSRIIGCLMCFGPVKEHVPNWSISFDHVFTLSHRRVGCAGTIQKSCCFDDNNNVINNYEWGDYTSSVPVNWDLYDSVKLSCHLHVGQTVGIDRNMLKAAAELNRVQDADDQYPLTTTQVECQVMKCFGDLLLNESIAYSEEGMVAAEKLAVLLAYPNVIETCRAYLMKVQGVNVARSSDTDDESRRILEFDLSGFDFSGNLQFRRQRMHSLRESDIISIFQQLCSIAFKREKN
uniref:BTB/POZ domain-containing protein n=1 Tax=Caenorhabditis tropicalis TaxID=1561998 RepID=A0A1I7T878_9PELO